MSWSSNSRVLNFLRKNSVTIAVGGILVGYGSYIYGSLLFYQKRKEWIEQNQSTGSVKSSDLTSLDLAFF
jgi:hypothetical protein